MNRNAKRLSLLVSVFALAAASTLQAIPVARAESLGPISFEPTTYAIGNINGQDGWSKTNSLFDVAVVANSYGFASFGALSLRLSDAFTTQTTFDDQTFAKPLVDAVGETGATAGPYSVGTRQRHFEMQFDIASTVTTEQPGMHVSVSPARGDASRMSYLSFEDAPAGIDVFFGDVQQPAPCTPIYCANFVKTKIATITRNVPHTIKLTMDVYDGPSNDVVNVFIDGVFSKTGTSWEDYYRYDPEQAQEPTPRIVRTILFREGGTANSADLGKGFLVDNLSYKSGPIPAAAPLPPLTWVKNAGNPVVPFGTCGTGVTPTRPTVYVDSTNYKMYFTSYPGDGASIFLATSTDGGLHWTCANANTPVVPLGATGAFDSVRAIGPTVIKDGATYKMWYAGKNSAGVYGLGYATSPDGVTWTKQPQATLSPATSWDSAIIRAPSVVKVGLTYHLWYEGTAVWPNFRIGHATSTDGINWTKDTANPVMGPSVGGWDSNYVYNPSVVYDGATFHMFYSGTNSNKWLTGHAISPDGIVWTKDANAILSPELTGWDSYDSLDYAAGVLDGSTWKVFYSGSGTSGYQIGLATLTNQAGLTFRPLASSVLIGQPMMVTIDLNNVASLYGYQFAVNYDATKVSATAAFDDTFFNPTGMVTPPTGWNANCVNGVCQFSHAQNNLSGIGPFTGSGPLATLTFTGLSAGLFPLTISSDVLSTRDGVAIPHVKTTAWVNVYSTATVNGNVRLQGRYTPVTAGTVTLYEQSGIFAPVPAPFDANTGNFIAVVPVNSGGSTYDLVVSHSEYLSNKLTGVAVAANGVVSASNTKLLGGDANNNGKVEIGDLTCIGSNFNTATTVCTGGSADINIDGVVNIQDLAITGGNYDLTSPQPW